MEHPCCLVERTDDVLVRERARLHAGEIDVNRYMDLKVDEATRGLHGVPRAELDAIKQALRDQMATDPGLTGLIRTATGQIPKPPED